MLLGLVPLFALPSLASPAKEELWAAAGKALNLSLQEGGNVIPAAWNGHQFLFVDYVHGEERELVALEKVGDCYRAVHVTTGEEEGGRPEVAAIGFANADSDPAQELIVILTWDVNHYDVGGTLYEVRIFDDLKPSQSKLTYLRGISHRFEGHNCDCGWRDGKTDRYPFKTIAKVKAELERLRRAR